MPERLQVHLEHIPKPKLVSVVVLLLVMVTAQISMPLVPERASELVTTVVLAFAVTSLLIATFSWKPERILGLLLLVPLGIGVELLGKSTGFPFGAYAYGDQLQPQILGVPLVVGLAWMAITIPAWEIARRITSKKPLQWLFGGIAITAWDLFLDPLMVQLGYWSWENTHGWQGIPLTNFAGWLVTGTILCAFTSRVLGNARANNGLAGLYIWMLGFSSLGFLLPLAFDRPIAGLVVVLVSAPLVAGALWPKERTWLR